MHHANRGQSLLGRLEEAITTDGPASSARAAVPRPRTQIEAEGTSVPSGSQARRSVPFPPGTAESSSRVLEDGIFLVDAIINHRVEKGAYEYQIRWAGHGDEMATWEPPCHVVPGCLELVQEYHARIEAWWGNIEAVLARKPTFRENDARFVPRAKYQVQWEGWTGKGGRSWRPLKYPDYHELIDDWYEGELRKSAEL